MRQGITQNLMKNIEIILQFKIRDKCDKNSNTNVLANNVIECMIEIINTVAPKRIKRIPSRWKKKPWIKKEVRNANEYKDWTYRNAIRTNLKWHWDEFKRARNIAVTVNRRSKRKYYEENIDEVKDNPKRM